MRSPLLIFLFALTVFVTVARPQDADDSSILPPKLLTPLDPAYPSEAKEAGIGGRVTVRVSISETGEVLAVDQPAGPAELCDGSNDDPRLVAMRASVVEVVKRARFSPATKDGKPVKTTVWVSSTFDPDEPAGDGAGSASKRKIVKEGFVAGKAIKLPKPAYPPAARSKRVSGAVSVRIVVDENGKVFTAEAVGGHPLLRPAGVEAACRASFSPTSIEGKPVRVTGVVTYNFAP
jgi:TonB family protein